MYSSGWPQWKVRRKVGAWDERSWLGGVVSAGDEDEDEEEAGGTVALLMTYRGGRCRLQIGDG